MTTPSAELIERKDPVGVVDNCNPMVPGDVGANDKAAPWDFMARGMPAGKDVRHTFSATASFPTPCGLALLR